TRSSFLEALFRRDIVDLSSQKFISSLLSALFPLRPRPVSRRLRRPRYLSGASLRTWSDSAGVHRRLTNRACRAQYDSARPANLLLVPRARARLSAPASCALRLECRQSLPGRSSTALLPLCAGRNSAFSACASSPARKRRGAADNWSTPVTSISPTSSVVLSESID